MLGEKSAINNPEEEDMLLPESAPSNYFVDKSIYSCFGLGARFSRKLVNLIKCSGNQSSFVDILN